MSTTPITEKRHARVDVADVLRGLAVMGIIVLHCIEHFNFYSFPDTSGDGPWLRFCDRAVWDGLFFVLGGKAYAIFAMLFGFSFFIQDDNQRMRGKDFRLRFCWRLFLLFLFGNINACFFTAEILVMYSLLGLVLVLTCRLSDKWAFLIACILMVQPVAIYHIIRAATDASYIMPTIPTGELWRACNVMQGGGNFFDTVKVNLWEGQLASLAWAWDNARIFQTSSLFILGMLVGRRGLLLEQHSATWGKILAGALIAFFPLYGLSNMLPGFIENRNILEPLLLIINSLHKFAFMLVLVSGVIFAYYRSNLKILLQKIIPYGRMSLTNYIMQSIIGSMLFYHWGFDLHDNLGITASALVGVCLFFLQWTFCRWWLKHHTHGPLEYLWKRGTWLK